MNEGKTNQKLRILHIILALTPTNGQYNEHCLPLMHERDITICTYFKSEIIPPEQIALFDGGSTIPSFFRALRAALKAKEYDIIHVHTPHAGILLLITLFLSGWYRKLKPSTVHTVQNSYQNFKLRNKLLFIPSFAMFQRMVFCSDASYKSFPGYMKWLASNRMHVVQNAVDLDRIDRQLRGVQTIHNNHFGIVTVGLIEMKNPFTVLTAFRQEYNETSELIYLGEGYLRSSLTQEIKNSGLERAVKLTGMISRDRVFEHFVAADLFISASWGEGLPVAVLEAMACSRPVLLSNIPPHQEIADGVDFIPLIKPDDVEGFAREIKRFREMSVSERAAIGQKCRDLVENRFSLPIMHSDYAKVYAEIMNLNKKSGTDQSS